MKRPSAGSHADADPTRDDRAPSLCLTPQGHLFLVPTEGAPPLDAALAERLARAFARGVGDGLLELGGATVGEALPPVFAYFRDLGARFVTALCTRPELEHPGAELPPAPDDLERVAGAAPPMVGAEYLTGEVLRSLWAELGAAFTRNWAAAKVPLADFLRRLSPAWNVVGRVHFNLAENRRDAEAPFAFLATFTDRLAAHGQARHRPLGEALEEYAGARNRDRLLALLLPVQRAAERCAWLRELVDRGEIFHPLRWSAEEAFRLLRDLAELDRAGIVVRMPAAWRGGRPSRPQVTATVGERPPSTLGLGALLDFRKEVTLDGERLTRAEVNAILASSAGLALVRGRWIEVDRARLARALARFEAAEALAARGGLSLAEATRLLHGVELGEEAPGDTPDWSTVVAGSWLAETLAALRSPALATTLEPSGELRGELRPYQRAGLAWLHLLVSLGLGACLADDMGLGKTIQVLALLLVLRRTAPEPRRPSLLVAPASLLANWAAEAARFAPTLRLRVAHPASMPAAELRSPSHGWLDGVDLVVTSYGSLLRVPWLTTTDWRLAILDEAQAIKNPGARQTRAVKELRAQARVALTGTPIENRLGDLWSLFDFLNPGLLGSARAFTAYTKALARRSPGAYGPLRELVRPYLLRRLKTDRAVIADLPEKTEVKAYCLLARRQVALYQQAVRELRQELARAEGIARRGLVLAFLMRFKQICNHPSQWLGDAAWSAEDSGKWSRLRELAEVIAAKQEKVLVFTQFREVTAPLAAFLGGIFGRPGLVLHGGTAVRRRQELVERFQQDERVPFFVLSLKAGGSGLNLTAASHVVHFDRWWNPAVESQATDRAFRIGQRRNVLVHKFVCRGTVEEKIDELIESKVALSRELLEGGAELDLTALPDEELLRLVSLDLASVAAE